jgi:hypothetical protein
MSINNADRFETVEVFWHVLQDSVTQKLPTATAIDQTQSTPPTQAIEDRHTQSMPKVQYVSHAHSPVPLRVISILLIILALAAACFSYLRDFTILLLCCLVVLILSIAVLLRDVTSRTRRRRSKELYKARG